MAEYHKHKGQMSNGELKSHPVETKHKDPKVQKWHDEAILKAQQEMDERDDEETEEDYEEEDDSEEEETSAEFEKLKNEKVEDLKGKLLEVKRVGASTIFIKCEKSDTMKDCLKKADVPFEDDSIKIEAIEDKGTKWQAVGLTDKAYTFQKIVVTTKVRGSY